VTEVGKFVLNAFGLSLSADGFVAMWLAMVPVTILVIALAYRLVRPPH
jgi:lipopolysaccharide export LptBFGC system permease protein LptF